MTPLCALLISTMRKLCKGVILRTQLGILGRIACIIQKYQTFFKIVNKNQDISVVKAHSLFLITMKKDRSSSSLQ